MSSTEELEFQLDSTTVVTPETSSQFDNVYTAEKNCILRPELPEASDWQATAPSSLSSESSLIYDELCYDLEDASVRGHVDSLNLISHKVPVRSESLSSDEMASSTFFHVSEVFQFRKLTSSDESDEELEAPSSFCYTETPDGSLIIPFDDLSEEVMAVSIISSPEICQPSSVTLFDEPNQAPAALPHLTYTETYQGSLFISCDDPSEDLMTVSNLTIPEVCLADELNDEPAAVPVSHSPSPTESIDAAITALIMTIVTKSPKLSSRFLNTEHINNIISRLSTKVLDEVNFTESAARINDDNIKAFTMAMVNNLCNEFGSQDNVLLLAMAPDNTSFTKAVVKYLKIYLSVSMRKTNSYVYNPSHLPSHLTCSGSDEIKGKDEKTENTSFLLDE